jgi:hypothetical protein
MNENYLKPYTDEEMLHEALLQYANRRRAFATAIQQPTYLMQNGEPATTKEIAYARTAAFQAERLVAYAKEKVESPIVLLQ